jgi:2-amino-4-hydroxy-6-hydroxymethyldihydropteridine diphosphokinase
MTTCYIGIGSNQGDRRKFIDNAIERLRDSNRIKIKRTSSVYETEPVSDIPQGKFLNAVLEIETSLNPQALLKELSRIEGELGRIRTVRNGPRTIDLDILYYGDKVVEESGLVIPHPRIMEREFVLRGLRELGKVSKGC